MAEWHGDCSRGSNREGHQHYSDDKSLVRSRQATSSSSSCTGDGRSSPGGEGKRRDVDTASCCLLDDLKKCHKKLGRLNFSSTHTVLVDVSIFNASEHLQPQDGRDMWHKGFVKMPFSPLSVVTTKTGLRKPTQVPRWEIISKKLDGLASKKKRGVDDVVEVIIKCNPQYTDEWTFDALFSLV
ncbi:poly(ADP-ribose) glycohydrolase-like isoform X2 [Hippoglossus hippoglossus]|uniref:poly(ADP-ribose) glycohydrolase-like isoform X2 n=1 Tax=Hippoglossus hippoglossus TaxID=8267 RepID=UPI00148BFB6C|nr:poly(ADP-ribose) glycohydrolase-like isoform X2 [Hippoglossus hippoglossus]